MRATNASIVGAVLLIPSLFLAASAWSGDSLYEGALSRRAAFAELEPLYDDEDDLSLVARMASAAEEDDFSLMTRMAAAVDEHNLQYSHLAKRGNSQSSGAPFCSGDGKITHHQAKMIYVAPNWICKCHGYYTDSKGRQKEGTCKNKIKG